ncbi:hypothetical protein GUJ93_ZPchr0006g45146 [Zizania palustris]|uniref:Cyclin N-terminal domain-containing protein n=1 Tax=Zizania palustris TaxID=103762 RepID=A0A8J5SR75_ZIZPA|nr:hypothetical protein GUJ93_ZPchr0006g45146 [Zizania palustris]
MSPPSMDEIMDTYTDHLLADTTTQPLGPFSFGAGAQPTPTDDLDDYLRSIGALPPRPAAVAPAPGPGRGAPQMGRLGFDAYGYLRAVGALPPRPAAVAPAPGPGHGAPQMGRMGFDAYGYLRAVGALPLPTATAGSNATSHGGVVPGLPAVYDDSLMLNASYMQMAVQVPSDLLPPPPGFSPLVAPARAEPGPGAISGALYAQIHAPPRLPAQRPAATVPVSDGSAASRPPLCAPYDNDIDENLRKMEKEPGERPSPDYLTTVHLDQINPSTRADLVAWMARFTRDYGLADGTLHRAVSYIDRFLSVKVLDSYTDNHNLLHLLGATAVFLAAKYESQSTVLKLNPTEIARYGGFTEGKEAIIRTEFVMIEALGYRLGGPTTKTFVDHFTRYSQGQNDLQVQRMAHRIADKSLRNYGCLVYPPSVVAAASIFKAMCVLNTPGQKPWSSELEQLTGNGDAAAKKRPWYKRALGGLITRIPRARPATGVAAPSAGRTAERRSRWWASVKAKSVALAREACVCAPLCSYDGVVGVHIDAVAPRRWSGPTGVSSAGRGLSPVSARKVAPSPGRAPGVATAVEGARRRRASAAVGGALSPVSARSAAASPSRAPAVTPVVKGARTRRRSASSAAGSLSPVSARRALAPALSRAPAVEGPNKRVFFMGSSLSDDERMRRLVLGEEGARRRGVTIEMTKRRGRRKWRAPGESRLRRMSSANATDAEDEAGKTNSSLGRAVMSA